MTIPTNLQIAALGAALETFSRRYKMTDTGGLERALTEVDTQTLLYVGKHPGCGPTDVARFLRVAMTTISSATDRLVKRGLLERHRPEGDRRAVALRLSKAGEAHVAAQELAHHKMFLMMLERLEPDERDSFIAMIEKIAYSEG
ncbi:MarR family winged helix-turn-helix transcriptional regulator [Phyllobacterium bourgognense]|uniref:DNA-binding MarR family transcriptional regulator n=1 Tax=Phyllobacterium bourgognense TaxID=314236 RepID=A0A368YNP8_9HYPH|nr:MarR family winged helix-turn-helix transcriptional regulator [Phyllobacterium bourgognense]RCW81229.1 DNA-binding MarR family transcriptional regulator [Phyllobacterium bourgognense]